MADIMIDLEGLGTGPSAVILTIGAQMFDPMSRGWHDRHYYARITLESQPDRNIQQDTIDWWATQPAESREEAFGEENRVPLDQALDELGRLIWQAKYVWANGPTYDMNILEHAYKSYNKPLPWKYYKVRDARTIYSLYPNLPKYPATHHALEDCQRQIYLLQDTFKHLNIREMR
jgi:3' exoribonuclease, RNase T-like